MSDKQDKFNKKLIWLLLKLYTLLPLSESSKEIFAEEIAELTELL